MVINSTHIRKREPHPLEGTGVIVSADGMVDCLVAGETMEEKLFEFDEVAMVVLVSFEAGVAEERCLSPSGPATG